MKQENVLIMEVKRAWDDSNKKDFCPSHGYDCERCSHRDCSYNETERGVKCQAMKRGKCC